MFFIFNFKVLKKHSHFFSSPPFIAIIDISISKNILGTNDFFEKIIRPQNRELIFYQGL